MWAYLTGYEAIRLRDEEGDGKLSNSEKNKRELRALHDSVKVEEKAWVIWVGRNDGVGSKQASLSKLVRRKKTKGLILERRVLVEGGNRQREADDGIEKD